MKCTICNGDMKPLFTSFYCDYCENRPKRLTEYDLIIFADGPWRTTVLRNGDKLPEWADRAWLIDNNLNRDPIGEVQSDEPVAFYSWELSLENLRALDIRLSNDDTLVMKPGITLRVYGKDEV